VSTAEAQRREYLLRVACEVGHIGGWRVDLGNAVAEWSVETARIHETPDTQFIGVQQAIAYYPPEYRDLIERRFFACAQTGKPFDEIMQIISARGNRVWVRAIGAPELDVSGRIVAVQGAFQDISEVVSLQERTSDLHVKLNRTLDAMGDAFITVDTSWCVTYLNRQARCILRQSDEHFSGRTIWELFPATTGTRFDAELRHVLENDAATEFEDYFQAIGAWLRVTANPSEDGVAVYLRDITQDRLRSQHLRLLEAAVSRMNDILLITDAANLDAPFGPRIVYANPAFERLTGYSTEELLGKTPRVVQGPETDRAELDRIRTALTRHERVLSEVINYGRNGRKYWLEMDISPLSDDAGTVTHFVALQRDTTERKLAEQSIRENERRFRMMAKVTGTAVWEWDLRKHKQWWSEGFEEIFGHPIDPSEAIPTVWRKNIHPDDAAHVQKSLEDLLDGKSNFLVEQYRFRCADGRWAWVEDRAIALLGDDGKYISVLGSLTDVTNRVELETRLRRSQKLEAIGQLTGGIAHDFNNLLTVVMGNAELLAEKLLGHLALQEMAEQVMEAAQRGAELTSQLLSFARRQVLAATVIDLKGTIKSIVPFLNRSLSEDIDLIVKSDDELYPVEVDRGQLENALLNLALNARDAMPEGGTLTINTYNCELTAEAAREADIEAGAYAVIDVTDSGIGIAQEDLDRVLEPFYSTKVHGSGLGLSMVFGFVKQSKGHLILQSELGKGTLIRMLFPRSELEQTKAGETEQQKDIVDGQRQLILVVEDDPHVRRNVLALLHELSYRTLAAENGLEALSLLKEHPDIALLFTDVVMPGGMNGRELADAAQRLRPDLRVLFTSGYTENAIVHNARIDRNVVLLPKPYRRSTLAEKLHEILVKPEGTG
jgi:PAS domain S-box-containing protein